MVQNSPLEIIQSKTGHPVPIINGIYLHSEYDPIKEAKKFVESQKEHIKRNNNIVVFGLGFGYHIDEIVTAMTDCYGTDFKLAVIEPNRDVVVEYLRHRPAYKSIVKIFCKENVAELFNSKELITFMSKAPGVICHPPSYNLMTSFYENILNYRSPQELKVARRSIKNFKVRREIARYPQNLSLSDIHRNGTYAREKWMEHLMQSFNSFAYSEKKGKVHE